MGNENEDVDLEKLFDALYEKGMGHILESPEVYKVDEETLAEIMFIIAGRKLADTHGIPFARDVFNHEVDL